LRTLVSLLLPSSNATFALDVRPDLATLHFDDGSLFAVPRAFERVTDLSVNGALASALSYARMPRWHARDAEGGPDVCRQLEHITVNDVFYRREPHMMRRYTALAIDNIRRDPVAFLAASAYRAARLFVIRGTSDQLTTQQFESSRFVYAAGTLLSATYLGVFLTGVVIALRRRLPVWLLLVPIAYVPATICFVLTNMRYTITVQPLMFVFVAVALLALVDRRGSAPHEQTR
jgi:hypothetical protein